MMRRRYVCKKSMAAYRYCLVWWDMFDQHLVWSVWSVLRSSVVCVLFTADVSTKHVSASVNHWWQQLSCQVRSHIILMALYVQHTWDVKMLPHWATAACFAWCTEKSQAFACWEETCILYQFIRLYHSGDLIGGSSSHKQIKDTISCERKTMTEGGLILFNVM